MMKYKKISFSGLRSACLYRVGDKCGHMKTYRITKQYCIPGYCKMDVCPKWKLLRDAL